MHSKTNFYTNNFNLIRLFAAAQVVHFHIVSIFAIAVGPVHHFIIKLLGFFPGVPIFFFVSGFLISKSWDTTPSTKDYVIKRLVRIEPALIASVIFGIVLMFMTGYLNTGNTSAAQIIELLLAKISIFQFFNPDYLRGYGDGVFNGSLWTITVEIQFYVLLPLTSWLLLRKSSERKLVFLILAFVVFSVIYIYAAEHTHDALATKLFKVSFLPWYYMFLTGVFFQRNFDFFYRHLKNKFLYLLPTYVLICVCANFLNIDFGNTLNPVIYFCLALLIFSAAYSSGQLANRLLKETDISYGTYLYHMPVINFFLYQNAEKDLGHVALIIAATLGLSSLSWFWLEKPSLSYAKKITKK